MGFDFCMSLRPEDEGRIPSADLVGVVPRRFTNFLLARGGFAETSAVHQLEQILGLDLTRLEGRLPSVDVVERQDGSTDILEEGPPPVAVAVLLADFRRFLAALERTRGSWEHIRGGVKRHGLVETPAGYGYLPKGELEDDLKGIIAMLARMDQLGIRQMDYQWC